ncbi:MAG: ribosome recycling factor [Candidatus Cloacimonetes bacterium]|nr:ribosome recycling factor [Candidatus Cloacimonadota bacterium]
MEEFLFELETKMDSAYNALLTKFSKTRTGRANASALDNIKIDYYGQKTPIKQLCNISIPESRMIVVQPWDKTTLEEIEKSILASNIGVTPDNDGNVIRLPFQPLTEETRQDIVKQVKKLSEDAKIEIRNIRRDGNDSVKKMKKNSEISEDEEKNLHKDIQELTDKWIEKISEVTASKEKEILEV